ncbi:hypothetical protein C8J57DRAFT_1492735 [Mycena rebaudengoi]|nr:hypothetical protein C8J57DRAFT_1492735 [Mycena rebaudengoi]
MTKLTGRDEPRVTFDGRPCCPYGSSPPPIHPPVHAPSWHASVFPSYRYFHLFYRRDPSTLRHLTDSVLHPFLLPSIFPSKISSIHPSITPFNRRTHPSIHPSLPLSLPSSRPHSSHPWSPSSSILFLFLITDPIQATAPSRSTGLH